MGTTDGAEPLRYALITPARDERENLARLAECVVDQRRTPRAWLIVDNGSADGTVDVGRELEREHEWIRLIVVPPEPEYIRGGAEVRAFMTGVDALDRPVDVVVKLDADVSFAPDFFDRLLQRFEEDPELGIASGICLEPDGDGWKPAHTTRSHARGATRAYRWSTWQQVSPLDASPSWDTIDELLAKLNGWRVATIDELPFHHHRRMGTRDGTWGVWVKHGDLAHYVGYRPSYVLARAAYRSLGDPAAVALVWGFVRAQLQRHERYPDPAVRRLLRDEQRLRHLPTRLREALGRTGPRA